MGRRIGRPATVTRQRKVRIAEFTIFLGRPEDVVVLTTDSALVGGEEMGLPVGRRCSEVVQRREVRRMELVNFRIGFDVPFLFVVWSITEIGNWSKSGCGYLILEMATTDMLKLKWTPQTKKTTTTLVVRLEGREGGGIDIMKDQIPQHDTEINTFSKNPWHVHFKSFVCRIQLLTSCTVSTSNQPRHTHQSDVPARH